LQQVRYAIQLGDLNRAEVLLANYSDHNAEWNFLKGAVCYRRGWMDEAKRYYQTACQMDPGNAEYRQALDYMENGPRQAYTPGGTTFGTDLCGSNLCLPMCCLWSLCSGSVPICCYC
jgi:molecular chaperone DnaJ